MAERKTVAEIFTGGSKGLTAPQRMMLEALFKGADKDGSGALDVKELKVLLGKIGILMSESDTASLMLSADRRRTGTLTFPELVSAFQSIELSGSPPSTSSSSKTSSSSSSSLPFGTVSEGCQHCGVAFTWSRSQSLRSSMTCSSCLAKGLR